MRKLTWAAIGFGGAAFLAEYILPLQGLPYIAAALAVLFGASLFFRGPARGRVAICLGAAFAGILAWGLHYRCHVAPGEAIAGQTVTVTARVAAYPETLEDYQRLEVRVLEGAPTERAILYLYEEAAEVFPGDVVRGEVRLRAVTENGDERIHSYTSAGVNLRGYVQGTLSLVDHGGGWRYFPKTLCQWVKDLCDKLFPADAAPFVKALLTGDTTDLKQDEGLYSHMRIAGVLHIVAVSGMHLVILVSLTQLLLGRSRRTSLLCIPVMVVFVLMAGCRASVIRAAVMQSFFLLAPLFERESDGPTSLSAALLVLLIANPSAIAGVGLQLSFLCVLGFVVLMPPMSRWMKAHLPMKNEVVRFVANSGAGTICAVAFSTPVAAFYFDTIPLLSVVSNLLTLPVVEICFGGGYILCALGAVWPAAAAAGGWVLAWCVRWCAAVYETIASIPFACLYTVSDGAVWWLIGVYVLWAVWIFLRGKKIRIGVGTPVCLCVIGLCAVFLSGSARLRPGTGELTVLDVGQGLCVTLLEDSASVVVDCGGSEDAGNIAANYLLAQGKNRVDLLVLTHLHDDHANGVVTLLSRLPVDMILMPESADDESGLCGEIEAAAEKYQVDVLCLERPCEAQIGGVDLKLYLPQAGTDLNERGIVVRAEMGAMSAYIMGDAGTDAELVLLSQNAVTDADILVVGHHGSAGASGRLFLQNVQAETAIISVGRNSYGLPAEAALERLSAYCPVLLRTDQLENITMEEKTEESNYGKSREESLQLWG